MKRRHPDIAIVGGGLVGATLACALAPLGYRVAVVEAVAPRASHQPSYDDRTLALGRASTRILDGLGLWEALRGQATAIREVIVTELGRPGRVSLKPSELGLKHFGHVVEARVYGQAVLGHLHGLDDVVMHCPAQVTAVRADASAVRLHVAGADGEEELQAALLVAADGAASTVRRLLGVAVREKDYGQTAVICNVTPERPHGGRAFERMTSTGPMAVLPHRDLRCGLVWCVASEDAQALLDMPEEEFLRQATRRYGGELGAFVRMGRRSAYPLKLTLAADDTLPRVVILGNAAHAIHPAGAQGFNLGLRDVAVLAEVLAEAEPGGGGDPGTDGVLQRYSEWRRPDREATVAFSDGMVSLFSSPLALSGAVRTLGLLAHGLFPPLRRRLATQAMGYRGRVPRLARGERLRPAWVADA